MPWRPSLTSRRSSCGKYQGGNQEPAIPGFSVSITILIPKKGLDDFDTDYDTQGWAKFDTDSDTDTKTLQML